jgi:hypothetical protein
MMATRRRRRGGLSRLHESPNRVTSSAVPIPTSLRLSDSRGSAMSVRAMPQVPDQPIDARTLS